MEYMCRLMFITFPISILILSGRVWGKLNRYDPDVEYNATQLIQSKGYSFEEHKVTTEDGYILSLFRIPHGRNSSTIGRPVLLQHGLLDSAATWVMNFPDQSLGFMLADAGYDVWLGNIRGNRYSRAHVKYDPQHDEQYWDFSSDEMASIDLPSMIFYILNITQQQKIGYVGHSQGTLIAFAEFGRQGNQVQDRVSFYAALAPVAQMGHQKTPLRYLYTDSKELERYWHQLFGRNEFLPSSNILKWLSKYVCDERVLDRLVCENLLFVVGGPDTKNMNSSRVPVYTSHIPAGTSVKNMVHFMQCSRSNRFQAYDYGSAEKNIEHYNQTTAPVYSIEFLNIPTGIFWGGEDWLADPTDVTYVLNNTSKLVFKKYISDYEHFDFVWSKTANNLIYRDLIDLMKKYH